MFQYIRHYLKKDLVLTLSIILALFSCTFNKPNLNYIDFKVIIILFNLMVVVAGLIKLNVLEFIAVSIIKKSSSLKMLYLSIIMITFFSSMIFTNDVALITFVPLTIIISKKINENLLNLIIIQTVAANLGSCFTPIGNPQNLYIYSHYNLTAYEFFYTTLPIVSASFLVLILLIFFEKKQTINFNLDSISVGNYLKIAILSLFFILIIFSVFNIINYKLVFLGLIIFTLISDRSLLLKVDYGLLITFISFFIFIGNLSNMNTLKTLMHTMLNSNIATFWYSLFLSQIISNVPATILLSGFTPFYKELLLGANVGGLGTLVASLASVISYKIYRTEFQNEKYILKFSIYNIFCLAILVPISLLLISLQI